jgi:hypothetical protein
MSVSMQLIRSRVDDELETRCTFFSLRSEEIALAVADQSHYFRFL